MPSVFLTASPTLKAKTYICSSLSLPLTNEDGEWRIRSQIPVSDRDLQHIEARHCLCSSAWWQPEQIAFHWLVPNSSSTFVLRNVSLFRFGTVFWVSDLFWLSGFDRLKRMQARMWLESNTTNLVLHLSVDRCTHVETYRLFETTSCFLGSFTTSSW